MRQSCNTTSQKESIEQIRGAFVKEVGRPLNHVHSVVEPKRSMKYDSYLASVGHQVLDRRMLGGVSKTPHIQKDHLQTYEESADLHTSTSPFCEKGL